MNTTYCYLIKFYDNDFAFEAENASQLFVSLMSQYAENLPSLSDNDIAQFFKDIIEQSCMMISNECDNTNLDVSVISNVAEIVSEIKGYAWDSRKNSIKEFGLDGDEELSNYLCKSNLSLLDLLYWNNHETIFIRISDSEFIDSIYHII